MGLIFFIFRAFFYFVLTSACLIGGAVVYTEYAQRHGIVKFESGGYMVFDAPQGTYIFEQSKLLLRLTTSTSDYKSAMSVMDKNCDDKCVDAHKQTGITMVKTEPLKQTPTGCTHGHPVVIPNPKIRINACIVTEPGLSAMAALFEVHPGKVVSVLMATSSNVPANDPNYINKNILYVTDIVNSANYTETMWPGFTWLNFFFSPKGTKQ